MSKSFDQIRLWQIEGTGVRERIADVVTALPATGALFMCLRARGHHGMWLAVAAALPLARFALSRSFRERILTWFARLWHAIPQDLSQSRTIPWAAAVVFVVLPSAALFLSNSRTIGSGDTWPVLPTACNLVTEGSWDLTSQLEAAPPSYFRGDLPYCTMRRGGVYSGYPAGMTLVAVPIAAAARLAGADLHSPRTHERLQKWTAAWLAAGSLGLFFLIALHLVPSGPALATTALLAFGSAMTTTCGQGLWQQGGVIFWMLAVLFVEFRRPVAAIPFGSAIQGFACANLIACRLSAGLIVAALAGWLIWRSPRRAARGACWAIIGYLPWLALHLTLYNAPLGPSVGQMGASNWLGSFGEGLAGVLYSPSRGLVVYQPWLAAVLVITLGLKVVALLRNPAALPRCGAATPPQGWIWFCLTVAVAQTLLVACWNCWWGGDCYGSRLVAETVPFLALIAAPGVAALWPKRGGRTVLALLLAAGFAFHAPALYWHADEWNGRHDVSQEPRLLWSWSQAPFLEWARCGNQHAAP